MSLDTKYRPTRYADVLGQEATKEILRGFVKSGKGFQQSYLFAGPFGSGKTTLGRILARALLCDAPVDGEPCDQCSSCTDMLTGGVSETYTEVDAATNSGVAMMRELTESLQYQTFSGKRKLYLFDESHQLSPSALDALLKPLEDSLPDSDEKKLVCIFCTTEPEKMRATILSRCAPAFVIRPLSPEDIARRMEHICKEEGVEYEFDALVTIASATECHIRDALKAIEGVRMLGSVSIENVIKYLDLDLNVRLLDILEKLPVDLAGAIEAVQGIEERMSPATAYERLAEAAMMAYQVYLGAGKPKPYWDLARIQTISQQGEALLGYASRFASRPRAATAAMLMCDVSALHHLKGAYTSSQPGVTVVMAAPTAAVSGGGQEPVVQSRRVAETKTSVAAGETAAPVGKMQSSAELRGGGVHVDRRAVRTPGASEGGTPTSTSSSSDLFEPSEFCRLLGLAIADQSGDVRGSKGRNHMDRS